MHLYGPRPCRARSDGQEHDLLGPSGALVHVHVRHPHTVVFTPRHTPNTTRGRTVL